MRANCVKMFALCAIFFLAACLPAQAGMLFADGVDVNGAATGTAEADAPPAYDTLPLLFEDMDEYDQIAMEPYRDTYDDLPIEKKAEFYSKQFEFMHNREPNFHPSTFGVAPEEENAPPEDGTDNREEVEEAEDDLLPEEGNGGPYDPLPMFFADMDQYEQIAMEPYRDKYDTMPVAEKAELYGRQFVFMNDREPNFDPAVLRTIRRSPRERPSAYEAKQFLYKPATPKPPRPKEKTPDEQTGEVLKALPGPWEANKPPEPEPPAEQPAERQRARRSDDRRMETLRQGWNAIDVIRGSRER